MLQVAVLYSVVLLSATLGDAQPCDSDAPDNCTFDSGLLTCKWTFDSNGWTYDRSSAVFGTGGSSGANVTSRTACSTEGDEHCLQVGYMFENNNIDIRVLLVRVRDEDDSGVQLCHDSGVQLCNDSGVQLCNDSGVQLCNGSGVQLCNDSGVQLCDDRGIQLCNASGMELYNDSGVQLCNDSGIQLCNPSGMQLCNDSGVQLCFDSGMQLCNGSGMQICNDSGMQLCNDSGIQLCNASGMQLCNDSGVQLCFDSGMQLCNGSGMQLCNDSGMQLCNDSGVQLCNDSGVQLCNDSGMQLCNDSGVQLCNDSGMQLCNDSGMQLCNDSGVQLCNDSGMQLCNDSREQVMVLNGTNSGVGVWNVTNIPIMSKGNFTIILEARKFSRGVSKIFIDYIKYIKTPCSALQTSTVQAASNNVGAVVGVVVAVIVIVVAVVIFILYRRKRLYLWKTCFINKNKKDATGTSHNGERSFDKHDRRAVNSFNTTPTVSGINNRAFTASEAHPSDTYYSVIKDTDGSGDSAAPHYSTIQECQSADGKTLPISSKYTDDDPYKIKSATSRNANANAHFKVIAGLNGNHLPSASNGGNRQAPSDYSLARGAGGEATGVYHCLEEDPNNHGEGGTIGLYHYAKDPGINPEASADATGVYHILEEDPANPRDSQLVDVYSVHQDGKMGHQQTSAVKASKGQTGNYNTLAFSGKTSGQMENEDTSGGVYNHLNAGSDDPYNEVDREKRAEVIDGEYSHIK